MTQPTQAPTQANTSPAQPTAAACLAEIVGERHVLSRPSELLVYNSDGLPGYRRQPRLAVFPGLLDDALEHFAGVERAGNFPVTGIDQVVFLVTLDGPEGAEIVAGAARDPLTQSAVREGIASLVTKKD